MITPDTLDKEVFEPTEATPLGELNKEHVTQEESTLKTPRVTTNLEKYPIDMPHIFVQERSPPCFPQRIRKAKEEQQFGKFMEVLKYLHINIPLIEEIKKKGQTISNSQRMFLQIGREWESLPL